SRTRRASPCRARCAGTYTNASRPVKTAPYSSTASGGKSPPATNPPSTVACRSAPVARTASPITPPATDRNRSASARASSSTTTLLLSIGAALRWRTRSWTSATPASAGTATRTLPTAVSSRIFQRWPSSGHRTTGDDNATHTTATSSATATTTAARRPACARRHAVATSRHKGPATIAQYAVCAPIVAAHALKPRVARNAELSGPAPMRSTTTPAANPTMPSTTTSHGAGDPGPAVTGPAGLRCCATATPPSACTSSASSPSAATARNGVVAAPASAAGGLGEDDDVVGVVPHGVVE